ncbi:peptidase C1B, bleomycin hydrolase [Ceraceosorus guamensis]|uniref:Cysteine proteinase 1, mitochondrial n=1 Tax=Ceraceosorus guamensis TaxID=1522189 RepID=A0A316VSL6_9BASI|nr:peptidase C1B, bleomycin hydrolase [Ceraceosorus guamensis]PWN40360.1 peptidase C1B, bleomycin hydrolase [Ceraceosorus guamensis]
MGSSASKPLPASGEMSEKSAATQSLERQLGRSGRASARPDASLNLHHSTDRSYKIQASRLVAHTAAAPQQESARDAGKASSNITPTLLQYWSDTALKTTSAKLAARTLHNEQLALALRDRRTEIEMGNHVFNVKVDLEGTPVCNQKSSGRCWLFATLNLLRVHAMKEYDVPALELSQSYLHFYDKLEKANTFLENTIDLASEALDSRLYGYLKGDPVNDGGQWDMVVNLLRVYGIVPQVIFPESFNSSNSDKINWLVTFQLRQFALELRSLISQLRSQEGGARSLSPASEHSIVQQVRLTKERQMKKIFEILTIANGAAPPSPEQEFTWQYYDSKGKYQERRFTPKSFLQSLKKRFDLDNACSLVNDPRAEEQKLITIDRLQNVWGARPVSYVNTSSQVMKESVIKSLRSNQAVFFGCDVGQFSHTASGVMCPSLYQTGVEEAFDISLNLSKAERLQMGESLMTHAMVITGVQVDADGKPTRYRVENSWSETAGQKGYMIMSDAWFDQYVFQVVVRKQDMPAALWQLFDAGVNEETIVYPPYDPFGSLA